MIAKTININYCENCLKNAHEEIKMIAEKVLIDNYRDIEILVCPACGSTKSI